MHNTYGRFKFSKLTMSPPRSSSWFENKVPICKTLHNSCERKRKLCFIFAQKVALCAIIRKLRFDTKLHYFAFTLFSFSQFCKTNPYKLRLIKGVNYMNYLSMRLHFLEYNCNAGKGTDYLPKTLLCNLMHGGTLPIKMCTLLHKNWAVFCQLLLLSLNFLICIFLGLGKKE